ncbi:MAG: hypothetical protein GY749_48185 [Desulfobacteraceae bacterium]|nr:hypothetical protein [Desulfobacteraceae bacterium]
MDYIFDPVLPCKWLKDLPEHLRPGYDSRMHARPDDGEEDKRILAIALKNPELTMKFITEG